MLVPLLAVAMGAVACGGSSPTGVASIGSTSTTTASSGSPAGNSGGAPTPSVMRRLLAFTTCMRANGEPSFPDPLPSGGYSRHSVSSVDPKSPQYLTAEQACAPQAEAIGAIHTPKQQQQHLDQLNAEDGCIRRHGVPDMPGPTAKGVQPAPQGVNQSQLQRAEKACAHLNP